MTSNNDERFPESLCVIKLTADSIELCPHYRPTCLKGFVEEALDGYNPKQIQTQLMLH